MFFVPVDGTAERHLSFSAKNFTQLSQFTTLLSLIKVATGNRAITPSVHIES